MNTNEQKFDCLSVTHVEVSVFKQGAYLGKLRGFATIVLNGQLQIRGLMIMDSENGLYVGYPTDPYCREDFQHMVPSSFAAMMTSSATSARFVM
jgi:stage V sporulation protein G